MTADPRPDEPTRPDCLVEVSWEVANMVGGIHTVLATKAQATCDRFGDDYLVVGPWRSGEGAGTSELLPGDPFPGMDAVWARHGMRVATGRWNVPGEPACLLVDFSDLYKAKDEILERLWKAWRVDSLAGGWDYVEPVLFGWAAGQALEVLLRERLLPRHRRIVAQWHEWMAASGMLYLKGTTPQVASVFTTHATVLGRSVSSGGESLDRALESTSPRDRAASLGITAKFSMESAAAREADCFTTVSALTAAEAGVVLGRTPDVVLPNGIGETFPPPLFGDPDSVATARYALLRLAEIATGKRYDRERTRLLMSAGRYEYVNKGLDLVLDVLGDLREEHRDGDRPVLAFLFHPAGQEGPDPRIVAARNEGRSVAHPRVCTHQLHDAAHDPVLSHLARRGIANAPADGVDVLFVPIYLNGRDGLFKHSFYELLPAFDLTLFPSLYEPWGYTPLESLHYGVPTVTSDMAGFGRWVRTQEGCDTAYVLPREGRPAEASRRLLLDHVRAFLQLDDEALARLRPRARACARRATWERMLQHYLEAYDVAIARRGERLTFLPVVEPPAEAPPPSSAVAASPRLHPFTVKSSLPDALRPLRDLAANLWWTWHPEAESLFRDLGGERWSRCRHNPVLMLETLPQARLQACAADAAFVARLGGVLEERRAYLAARPAARRDPRIAYFSMEFGLHESVPFYSGGLGVLAGDHLKAASDLGLPLVAVGIAWRQGYFRQGLDRAGHQIEERPVRDFTALPMEPVLDEDGQPRLVSVRFPGRSVAVQAWRVPVGAVDLLLLDTDVPGNASADRGITGALYQGDMERRLQQELVLGVGGRKLLVALGLDPRVYHLNEGHAALLLLNRIIGLIRDHDLDFGSAVEAVRRTSLFTTHTPVPAGHDVFEEALLRPYLSVAEDVLHVPWRRILGLGRADDAGDAEPFSMTVFAMRGAASVNAVSETHRKVTQLMFARSMPGFPAEEVAVASVTNGAHAPTWVAPDVQAVLDRAVGPAWRDGGVDAARFDALRQVPASDVLRLRRAGKRRLLEHLRARLASAWHRRHDAPDLLGDILAGLDERALVVGFARRFVSYKRPLLLFRDLEALRRLVGDPERPVRFLFAGKAHPQDGAGKELLRQLVEHSRSPELAGRVIVLEDYDMGLARHLVQGCDVWLNTPTHLMEASGTSGMKSAMNGGLNLSVLDGWWVEGWRPENGWAVGGAPEEYLASLARGERGRHDLEDEEDASHLHHLLATQVVPRYFDGDEPGGGEAWTAMVRESMVTALSRFGAHRMVKEYEDRFYAPARRRYDAIEEGGFVPVHDLCEARRRIAEAWPRVAILEARMDGLEEGALTVGDAVEALVRIDPAGLGPGDLSVELVHGARDELEVLGALEVTALDPVDGDDVPGATWRGVFRPQHSGPHAYGLRVRPRLHLGDEVVAPDFDFHLVRWL